MEMKDEIEDEEITLEEFIDKKILDLDMESVERMYNVASQCLNERKNRRPLMNEVCIDIFMFVCFVCLNTALKIS